MSVVLLLVEVMVPGAFFILNQHTAYYTVTNVQPGLTNYAVTVTNAAKFNGNFSTSAFLYILPDSDGDGLPDEWETRHGLSTNSVADALEDFDGDGMSNRAEYIAGTNPTNSLSYLKVDATVLGGGAAVSFGAISNRTYTIQFTDALGSGPWLNLGDVPARATNRVETINDATFNPSRYYRIATPQQP